MYMVRHQGERIDIVAHPIEVQQTTLDLSTHIGPSQVTGTHAGVQPFLYAAAEPLLVLALLRFEPRFRMPSQPGRTFISPLMQQRLRK
jgi:hypothetical protein